MKPLPVINLEDALHKASKTCAKIIGLPARIKEQTHDFKRYLIDKPYCALSRHPSFTCEYASEDLILYSGDGHSGVYKKCTKP